MFHRFEAEISRTSKPMIPSTLNQPPQHYPKFFAKPTSVTHSAAVPSSTFFLPTQLQRAGVRPNNPSSGFPSSSSQSNNDQVSVGAAAVISNKPVLYLPEKESKPVLSTIKAPVPIKKQKIETKPLIKPPTSVPSTSTVGSLSFNYQIFLFNIDYTISNFCFLLKCAPSVLKAPSSTVGSATVKQGEEPKVVKYKKPKKFIRAAGGVVWQDDSLLDWDPSNYSRIIKLLFCV